MIDKQFQILRRQMPPEQKYVYKKADALYQMTYAFCKRFLPAHGDRTVDQMVQAARSGKQNIIEGMEDGKTSVEMHMKLLNVARASLKELREDYHDYLSSRSLTVWTADHPRFDKMRLFCRSHNEADDYRPLMQQCSDEEMANVSLTLCYIVDAMLNHELQQLEADFVANGGIKERMHAARTGYRQAENAELAQLRQTVPQLQNEIARLQQLLKDNGIEY